MKRELHKLKIIIAGFVLVFLYSCHSVDEYANDPYGNFDALWSILDERYCFLNIKILTGIRYVRNTVPE